MADRFADHAEMLRNRVRKRHRHLRKWARRHDVACYRVYDRDIPEIPLAVDRYESALHVAHFEREPAPTGWLDAMAAAAADALELAHDAVWTKRHVRQRGASQYGREAGSTPPVLVTEGGLRFEVNLGDYLDTGLFLDHRITRGMVRRDAAGARVLNLFCYTGAFTAYAAAGGARRTVSVDLSRAYLAWARRNLAHNGLDGPAHELVRADALEWLRAEARRGPRFDLIVLDPPTFSNSKKMRDSFDVARDHTALIDDALALLASGGALYFSTNRRSFELEPPAGAAAEDITDATWPPDFRRRPHRAWRIRP